MPRVITKGSVSFQYRPSRELTRLFCEAEVGEIFAYEFSETKIGLYIKVGDIHPYGISLLDGTVRLFDSNDLVCVCGDIHIKPNTEGLILNKKHHISKEWGIYMQHIDLTIYENPYKNDFCCECIHHYKSSNGTHKCSKKKKTCSKIEVCDSYHRTYNVIGL